ncbi:MAG: alpha-amylase [Muribaculaceae bacterium]|nr:alpha-amylase [Muribaculaceae bacterium]
MKEKPIIYQLLPRLFTNPCNSCIPGGTIAENGVGKMNSIDNKVLRSLKSLGVTHVWYTGIIEHATCTSYAAHGIEPCNPHVVKGQAGSPYAIIDYYDVAPDLAVSVKHRMNEFESLVTRTHAAGMKVIIDFVPNHVARQYHSDAKPQGVEDLGEGDNQAMFFSPDNNFFYITGQPFTPSVDMGKGKKAYVENPARATGNDCYNASPGKNDWYETVKLNYGIDPWNGHRHFRPIPSTWHKMLHILQFWAGKGVDGFRCDMAHMVPVEFWHWAIEQVKATHPGIIFIAEIYDPALYRSYIFDGGFDYLYDKVTLYDTLFNTLKHNASASRITHCWQAVDDIKQHMLNFLENHDELRIASPQFCGDAMLALPALVVSATMSSCPFMVYAGQELGEPALDAEGYSDRDGRTTIFDYWSIPTVRTWYAGGKCSVAGLTPQQKTLRRFYQRLLKLCNSETAIRQGAFFDLMYVNNHSLNTHDHYAYLRHNGEETILIVANFGNETAHLCVNIPQHAFDCLGFEPGARSCTELLTDATKTESLQPDRPFTVTVPAHNAVMWKMNLAEK